MKTTADSKSFTKTKTCLCGCGKIVARPINSFIKGHNRRGIGKFKTGIYSLRLCLCGCGKTTKKFRGRFNKYVKGHENIGKIPWNKGKSFSKESRRKMSLARLGREPANKVSIDLKKLYRLYVREKKTASTVSREMNISLDVVKNRLRALEWSRSTKESCSEPHFKERMRRLRIKTLSSQKAIETPNQLEKLVYSSLDKIGIGYKKQAPLFDKFVVDILIPQIPLVIEVFGRYWHEKPQVRKKDFSKKKYLEKCGYEVEELWDYEIKEHGPISLLKKVLGKHGLI